MRRSGNIRVLLALLSATLVVVQVIGASLVAAKSGPVSKTFTVICTVHRQMTVDVDLPDGQPTAPAKHDCPCCLAGWGLMGALPPFASVIAYDLGKAQPHRPRLHLESERAPLQRTGGEPASPRAPPAA